MTLNTKIEVLKIIFLAILGCENMSRANCAEITRCRQGQAACEIFSTERRF